MDVATPTEIKISDHVPALDGVRGLAILLVFMIHFGGGRHFSSPIFAAVGQVMAAGWVGVDLFFVLSGFLISNIILKTLNSPDFYRSFYARRFLRIFPVYYLALGVVLAISLVAGKPWRLDQYSFFFFGNNIAIVFDPIVAIVGPGLMLSAFWSLAVEEQFYLIWPFLLRSAVRRKWVYKCLFVVIVIAFLLRLLCLFWWNLPAVPYNLLFTRMDSLAFGATLAVLTSRGLLKNIPNTVPLVFFGVCVAVFFAIGFKEKTLYFGNILMQTVGLDVTAFGAFCLIWLALVPKSAVQKFFSVPLLRFYGKYSYGMYVYHQIFIVYFMKYIFQSYAKLFHNQGIAAVLYFVSCVLIVTAVSVLSFHYFEAKILTLKKFFPYRKTTFRSPKVDEIDVSLVSQASPS